MKKQQKHFLIAVLAGVLLYFLLPEANGLTKAGIAMLSVFLPTIYLWLTCGTSWTSLLSVTVAVLLGTYAGANAYGTFSMCCHYSIYDGCNRSGRERCI